MNLLKTPGAHRRTCVTLRQGERQAAHTLDSEIPGDKLNSMLHSEEPGHHLLSAVPEESEWALERRENDFTLFLLLFLLKS